MALRRPRTDPLQSLLTMYNNYEKLLHYYATIP